MKEGAGRWAPELCLFPPPVDLLGVGLPGAECGEEGS